MKNVRNRIKEHRRVRAGDLLGHELNWRTHPEAQRAALAALYREVGFARSLLAFETADGRLKLIDGHLRRDLDPDMLVDVEVLDVNEDEARKLVLAMDPLAGLAGSDPDPLGVLADQVQTQSEELRELIASLVPAAPSDLPEPPPTPEQFLVLVECDDEAHQVQLLQRFQADGLKCRALLS